VAYRHLLLDIDRDRHVATVTLNKPERLNAIDQDDKFDILDVIDKLNADDDVWVIIWTGAGRGFCSGADLQGPRPSEREQPLNGLLDEETWISRQGRALYEVDKPMIAAVNGVAAGAGFSLALCCDLRVGTPHSRFVSVFQERSLPPEGGMSFLLSRVVGLSRAMDICLTSRRVEAEEAFRIGLLDRLEPVEELMTAANALADRMCHLPPAAVRVSKRAIRAGLEASFAAATANETKYGGIARRAKHDAEESVKSFVERRTPRYTGR